MTKRMPRRVLATCVLAMSLLATGCAKKAVQAPPAPPPAPAQAEKPPAPPAPEKTETPPAPKVIGSGDFEPAFFDFDSYALREDARTALDHDAKVLRGNADAKITVEGHCDERGTAEYNQALGERRAQAAKDYLVNAGIDGSRIQTVSYGKERPFDPGHDEAAWAKNRRAHFVTR